MANTFKILGQSAPAATSDTDIYTVPPSTETCVSSLSVCNRGSTSATFRVFLRPNGAVKANQHYIYYDVSIPGNDTFIATIGITMDASDVVSCYASTADLTFQIFGYEIT